MECPHPDSARLVFRQWIRNHIDDSGSDFSSRLIRKGHRQNTLCRNAVKNHMGHASSEHPGFARSGAGDDERRRIVVFDRRTLGGVEAF